MDTVLTLEDLRQRWNDVLDLVERQDRITWMAFFDARLASFDGKVLTLDYSDSGKFGSSHQFPETRERQLNLLKAAVKEVCGVEIEVEQRP
ncbi:unannotated protein [freshwater metagenome]|uniref:Unannotated protein n=1 Tax=freshwater metagenome TaxID=449393 RepID=A0A6J6ESM4_9ZZZZ